ncbi:37S ribosomal protein S16, mitochondrial [Tieghemiomyces parasiticus]|uniref:37S ribosomal protein S16, mitochondrial n=1 Tax=Tieghemiomyces parasiticus TaxID=78921 RepID=A0A9W8DXZ0_9FUNG|nr:37S ribosomal protein S16, mitochondrial [Tieghemiomyces parasiticus]KAJ1923864.1 37S ribosomal protein S16, mitochondrial [Tieghemiomyces parasiticus]
MVVRIRFAMHGSKHKPLFHIVAANCRTRRNSKPLELLGKFSPLADETGTKHVELNMERAKYWLSVGAQPSDPARHLLEKAGLMPPKPAPWRQLKVGEHKIDPPPGKFVPHASPKPAPKETKEA